jgi:hypothetical protein
MGFLFSRLDKTLDLALKPAETKFAVDAESMPAQIFGLESYTDPIAPAAKISRREAIQCAAVISSRRLITTLGTFPLDVYDVEHNQLVNEFLEQPERGRSRSKTMIDTLDDLLFEGVAYWRVTERRFDGYPSHAKRLHPSKVDISDSGTVRVDGKVIPTRDLIQFESPHDPLLIAGARAIRTCLRLEAAAANYSDGAPPLDYFTPSDGADPADDADVIALLDSWKTARKKRSTAYVPASLKYNVGGWSPEQLQLADARQHAVLEIARAAGVDPEELGVSTTSRTYANQFDRNKHFIDFCLGPFRAVIEERLSMGDITKRGQFVRFNLDSLLRSDPLTRMQTYDIGLRVGAITAEEVRDLEDRPALAKRPTPTPVPVPAEVTPND